MQSKELGNKNSSTLIEAEQIFPAAPQPFFPGILDDDYRRARGIPKESDLGQNRNTVASLN